MGRMTMGCAVMLVTAVAAVGVANAAKAAPQRGFEVRDLAALERVSSPLLSPDGSHVLFAARRMDMSTGKAGTALYVRNLRTRDLAPPRRLTPADWNVNSPSLSADGGTVYFLSARTGSQQLYAMPLSGEGAPRQLTGFALDVGSYRVAPDDARVAFSAEVFLDCAADFACTADRLEQRQQGLASGVVYEQLFVRHWDTWSDGRRNALFVAPLPQTRQNPATQAVALSTGLEGDLPSKPFGGAEDYAWAPDGRSLVGSLKLARSGPGTRAQGVAVPPVVDEAWSTNFDLYRFDAAGGQPPVNLTSANPAWDAGPVFSPDGTTLYYRAMKRPGFEADRFGLVAMDLGSGQIREIAAHWDRSADAIVVSPDGRWLYASAQDLGRVPLFRVEIATGLVEEVAADGSVSAFQAVGDTLAFTRNSLHSGDQVFVARLDGSAPRAITPSTAERLPEVAFGDFEQFKFKGWNGETVHGYVVKPWDYRPGQRYPVAFLIHGGPQGSFGNGWSYRWNPQTYAGQGYAVVMIDFHGSVGYGQAFTDAISGHWGDRPLEDLQKGWAHALGRYAFLDGERACALGASYGGYMINWIAGNWNAPWKCLVNHDGVFDTRAMGYVTEELWFTEWENGGTPYDVPKHYEQFNPVNHVGKWRVPMLVVQGEKDYRVPVDQGLAAFTALQRRGIESKLLYFPDENHWVLKPHNSILWHDTVNDWLKRYIGN